MDQLSPNEQELEKALDSAPEAPEELEICPPEPPVEEAGAADTDAAVVFVEPVSDSEFDLESIIREFRDAPEEPAAAPDEVPEEVPVEQPAVTQDTIRLDTVKLTASAYSGAAPVEEDEEETPATQEEAPKENPDAEPFSEQWEPEYEQPMGEYVPPQPIQFHPQSRLKELKKKLVAGPERIYYKLSEIGTGKLQVALFISIIVTLLCVGSTVLYHFNMVQPDRMKLMIFGQLLSMFLCALLGCYQLIDGLGDLFRGRFSLNTLLIFSFILCCADGFICLQDLRVPCCASFTLQTVLSLFDALHRRRTELSQMDILRKATDLTAVRPAEELLDGKKVLLRDEGQVEDFMDHYLTRSVPEKIRSWYAIGALLASLGVGVAGYFLYGLSTALQIAAVTILAAVPASFFVCFSRPADILQKRFHKLGTVICGWQGSGIATGELVFPLTHQDLFPTGSIKMNGVKFFGTRDPDEIVAYGTALILADTNGLAPLFEQVLESRNCHHLTAQNLTFYDGGICGEVRGEPVMVGSLHFLKEMGVEIPEGLKVSQAVCVAVDGVLSGLFAISYEKTRSAASGLQSLCYYRQVKPVVSDGDFLLNPNFIHNKFGIKANRIQFADTQLRQALQELKPGENSPAAVITTQQNMTSLAHGITGARALRSASMLGLAVHMAGGIIGIGIMLTLTLIGATHLLTPLNVILYQLVWSIPGILMTEWTRLI